MARTRISSEGRTEYYFRLGLEGRSYFGRKSKPPVDDAGRRLYLAIEADAKEVEPGSRIFRVRVEGDRVGIVAPSCAGNVVALNASFDPLPGLDASEDLGEAVAAIARTLYRQPVHVLAVRLRRRGGAGSAEVIEVHS